VKKADQRRHRWSMGATERRSLLIIGDLLSASLAAFLALALWAQFDWLGFSLAFIKARANWFIFLPPLWLILMVDLYDIRRASSWRHTIRGILLAAVGGVFFYLLIYFTSSPGSLPRRGIFYFLLLVVVMTLIWRWVYVRVFTTPTFMKRVLVVGAGDSGRTLLSVIKAMHPPPFFLVGLVDDDISKKGKVIEGISVLGDNTCIMDVIQRENVSEIIVAILGSMNGEMFQALLDVQERGVKITRMPVSYEELLGRLPIRYMESDWLLRSFVDDLRVSSPYLLAKRLLDLLGSLIGVMIFLVTFPWIAAAILIDSGRPVFFKQSRLGRGGYTFNLIKYRTMRQDAEADGEAHWARKDDPRATRLGRILRRTHLDELPQFWNVLRGDMSVVGPRPERPELVAELQQQIPFYRARLLTKPGITGWAQVNFGKGASVEGSEEKLEYDLYYIKHRNLIMDLWIIMRTIASASVFQGV
jgi:exopolysaccharide biosynthesis polyprenyl glycosylphosphotransferase